MGLLVAAAVLGVGVDRYLEWDEAVFFSQSGTFEGSGAPPAFFHASREIGPAALIRALRLWGAELAEVRMLWAAVSLVLIVVAFREVGRVLGGWTGIAGAVLFAGNWLGLLFLGSFYGSQLAATAVVLSTALYLRVRGAGVDRVRDGLLLGAVVALAFWFRQVESLIVVACLSAHALLDDPRGVLLRRGRAVGAAALTFFVAFVVPWVLDSVARYGSVARRLALAEDQEWPTGEGIRVVEYLRTLVGVSDFYTPAGAVPRAAVLAMCAAGLVFVAGVVWLVMAAPDRRRRIDLLLVVLMLSSLGFFALYASNVRDRYALFGLAFASVLGGRLVDLALRRMPVDRPRGTGIRVGAAAAVAYLALQLLILGPYESARLLEGRHVEGTAQAMRVLAGGGPCVGIARYGSPQLQVGSGCVVDRGTDPEGVARTASALNEDAGAAFIVWPGDEADALELALPSAWERIDRPEPRLDVLFVRR